MTSEGGGVMDEFEVTCKVTKGERDIAYGEDCYCYYTHPNYNERIVRCKDCNHRISADNGFVDVFGQWYCEHLGLGIDPDFFCADGEPDERP